jgi:hypothetical protein
MSASPAAPEIRQALLDLFAEDQRVREELAGEGSLFKGYNARMREVHERNAAELEAILAAHGWPGIHLAGKDGAEAAWRIAQHAIAMPRFQRRCLKLLQAAVSRGDAEAQHAAYLDDRIAFNERRPQKYGTQFDWDEAGRMSPHAVDDAKAVDRRRRALGMTPFEDHIAAMREQWRQSNEPVPGDWHARQREMEAWAREVGWLPPA